MIALVDGQKGPNRNAPVPWQERSGPCDEGSVQREALNLAQPVPQSPRLNKGQILPPFGCQDDKSSSLHSNSKELV